MDKNYIRDWEATARQTNFISYSIKALFRNLSENNALTHI